MDLSRHPSRARPCEMGTGMRQAGLSALMAMQSTTDSAGAYTRAVHVRGDFSEDVKWIVAPRAWYHLAAV